MDIKETISNIMAYRYKHVDLARNKPNKFKTRIETEFSEFSQSHPQIFRLCLEGFFDNHAALQQLDQFINMSEKVHSGEIDKHDASVAIGEKLVNQYVKPLIDEKDIKKNE